MKLEPFFKDPNSEEYGQFIILDAYPSNKDVIAAKRLLREGLESVEMRLGRKQVDAI